MIDLISHLPVPPNSAEKPSIRTQARLSQFPDCGYQSGFQSHCSISLTLECFPFPPRVNLFPFLHGKHSCMLQTHSYLQTISKFHSHPKTPPFLSSITSSNYFAAKYFSSLKICPHLTLDMLILSSNFLFHHWVSFAF